MTANTHVQRRQVLHKLLGINRLTERREALGLSRAELATIIGVSRVSMWRWETGRAIPYPLAYERLWEVLTRLEGNIGLVS